MMRAANRNPPRGACDPEPTGAQGHTSPRSSRARLGSLHAMLLPMLAALVVVALAIVAVGSPFATMLRAAVLERAPADAPSPEVGRDIDTLAMSSTLLFRSLAWSAGAALAGLAIAWPAARALRDAEGGLTWMVRLLAVLPLVLPPWLLYAGLWLSIGPGTAIGDLLEAGDLIASTRPMLLAFAICLWSASLTFAVLSLPPHGSVRPRLLATLDGSRPSRTLRLRLKAALRADAPRLAIAAVSAILFLLSETMVFDLAQVTTVGFELRTVEALGADDAVLLRAAAPTIATTLALLAGLGIAIGRARRWTHAGAARGARIDRAPDAWARAWRLDGIRRALPIVLATLLAVGLLARAIAGAPRSGDFLAFHGRALLSTVAVSIVAASLVGGIAVSVVLAGMAALPRTIARAAVLLLAVGALVPGAIVVAALVGTYNRSSTAFLYDGPAILVIALVARIGLVGAVVGVLTASARDREAALATLDSTRWWHGAWRMRRRLASVGAIGAAVALPLALGELVVTGRLAPPGVAWLATDVLNAIHYQRPETVLLSLAILLVVAAMAAFAVLALLRGGASVRHRVAAPRRARTVLAGARPLLPILLALAPVLATGCAPEAGRSSGSDAGSDAGDAGSDARTTAATDLALVGTGRAPGQFNAPRVVAHDPVEGTTFVIDKDARVQRFDRAGRPAGEWRMPKSDRGKPVGASIAPDGSLVVADTHEHRIVAYAPDGTLLWQLGSYGMGEGEFIYPTDIAFAPDGRMFISEYGSNDRIQVFDRDRRFLYAFGRCGSESGEFLRPQSLAYDAARDELFVADAGNHRIQVFTGDGEFRRILGGPGRAPGELGYPFGIVLEIDGRPVATRAEGRVPLGSSHAAAPDSPDLPRTILVAEHSNHRIQRLDAETGEPQSLVDRLAEPAPPTAGSPPAPTALKYPPTMRYPWALEPAGFTREGLPRIAVCDQGRSRIVFLVWPAETSATSRATSPSPTPDAPSAPEES